MTLPSAAASGILRASTMSKKPKQAFPKSTGWLQWPPNLIPTTKRLAWFKLLSSLPPGLTLGEMAKRLGRPYYHLHNWFDVFCIPRPGRRPLPDWVQRADWSMTNPQLAAKLGVSFQAVYFARVRAGKPVKSITAPIPGATALRAHLATLDKQHRLTPDQINALVARFGISEKQVKLIVYSSGFRLRRGPRRWAHLDWRLSNSVLAEIWGAKMMAVSHARGHHGRPPQWKRPRPEDPAFREVVKQEAARAKKARAGGKDPSRGVEP